MTDAAKKLLEAASALQEDERLELASELIASVKAARDRGEPAPEWSEVRARVLGQLAR
jgi:hypothetical protein